MAMPIRDTFDTHLAADWHIGEIGQGRVQHRPGEIHLTLPGTDDTTYHDAQLTDYDTNTRQFQYRPPLRLSITAYTSHPAMQLRGTAGFGFWNHPFVPGERGFRLPQAVWFFFAAPPSNMALALDVPGLGWKTSTFNAQRWQFLALLPVAPLGFLLMRSKPLYRRLWPVGQRAIGVSETLLDADLLTEPHTYTLEWREDGATFAVDNRIVHHAPLVPQKALGFIAWIDNQYAVVTPQGKFGFGVVNMPHAQSLVLQSVAIEPLEG